MKVKATKKGFDGTAIREPGDVFDMPDFTVVKDDKGKETKVPTRGSWFEQVKAGKDQKAEGEAESLV